MSTKNQNVFILFLEFFLCLILLFSSIIIRKEQRCSVEACASGADTAQKSVTFTQLANSVGQILLPSESK